MKEFGRFEKKVSRFRVYITFFKSRHSALHIATCHFVGMKYCR